MTDLPAILGVDGGNSKVDLALVAADGTLLAALRGPTVSHQAIGLEAGMARLRDLATRLARQAGMAAPDGSLAGPIAGLGVYSLAGADYPEDMRLLRRAIGGLGLTRDVEVLNDTFGALRAGTHRPWGVVLICGQGINAAAVAPNGRTARFDGVGEFSGDWGGAGGVGRAGLAAAVRGHDGRGPRTSLQQLAPEHFGVASPPALTKALYLGRIDHHRIPELCPVVFRAAGAGDAVARSIVDQLADELAGMATALIRRLRLAELDPEVVLAGGVFATTDRPFYERLAAGIEAVAPRATLVPLAAPPVLGASLLGLDRVAGGATPEAAAERLRASLIDASLTTRGPGAGR